MKICNIITVISIIITPYICAQTVNWMNTYNSGYPQSGYSDIGMGVFEDEDSEILVIANTEYLLYDSSGHYLGKGAPFLIIKTDENGNMIDRSLYCDPDMFGGIRSSNNIFEFGVDTIIAVAKENVNDGTRVRHKIRILGIDLDGDSLFCSVIDTNMNLFWPTTSPTNDGNLITGSINVIPSDDLFVDSMLIFKHTITGEILWSRRFSMTNDPFHIFPTEDDGFLICDRNWMMKVDSLGDSLWAMTLPHYATPTSIIETAPNEFLCLAISGYCYIAVYKLLGDGEIDWWRQWMFDYSDTSYLYAYSLIPTFDGNYVFCGQTGSYMGTGHQADAFLVKIDSLANVIWQERYDLYGRPDIFHSVIQTRDSSFVCTGSASLCTDPDSFECESLEVSLVKISNDGDIIWENSIPVPKHINISAYPNPFNSAVTITAPAGAEIEIFDVNGRRVDVISMRDLPEEKSSSDAQEISRQARNDNFSEFVWTPDESFPSGVYLVRATIAAESGFDKLSHRAEQTTSKRIVYLK